MHNLSQQILCLWPHTVESAHLSRRLFETDLTCYFGGTRSAQWNRWNPWGPSEDLQSSVITHLSTSMHQGFTVPVPYPVCCMYKAVSRYSEGGNPEDHGPLQRAANEHNLRHSKRKVGKKANRACFRDTQGGSNFWPIPGRIWVFWLVDRKGENSDL